MKVISEHISYLLRYHDCVIVPGFGAFVRSYSAARLTPEGILLPPQTDICFNTSIASNDGMLAHSLMRREGISFEQARLLLSDKTDLMRKTLGTDGEIQIGDIGVITKDDDDLLSFTPAAATVPSGLEPLTRAGLVPSAAPRQAEAEEPVQKIGRRSFNTRKNYYLAINKQFAKVAASAVIGIACAATFVVPSLNSPRPTAGNYASVVPVNASKTVITDYRSQQQATDTRVTAQTQDARSEAAETAATAEETTASNSATAATVQTSPAATSAADGKYYLIVATFSTPAECGKFIDSRHSTRKLGIAQGGKISRVYYASSDNRQQLLDIMNSSTFKAEFSDAWIWERP